MEGMVIPPPAVFNVPPPTVGSGLKNGPSSMNFPVLFNPNQPPPSFSMASTSGNVVPPGIDAASSSAAGPSTNVPQSPQATGPTQGPGLGGMPPRLYRFKPAATVNLAEMEGYGRRLRRNMAQVRRHIDSVASVLNYVENRVWQSGRPWDRPAAQPHILYSMEAMPPHYTPEKPIDCVTTKYVRAAMNKVKCPVYDICWTPEGRRLITGASSGEFTLWNGTAFNFETILQAHDTAVRAIKWSHNDQWMISADHDGFIKYWQANMNNVTMFQAHKEAVRSVSFCPSDVKFATASDDGTVRVWDFIHSREERILRGHGSDVRSVDWHPKKALLVSGSRDSQQPVKLWDPRTGQCLATLHDHKNAVMAVQWNDNGNWLLTGSRDHVVKLYDIRMMKEVQSFRGHKKEVTSLAWHPVHEALFVSGGADGALMFWSVTNEKEVGIMENAHEQAIWSLKWHPLGHILASGSNDNNTKFWTRNKPGDMIEDFYFITGNPYEYALQQQQRPQYPPVAEQQQQIAAFAQPSFPGAQQLEKAVPAAATPNAGPPASQTAKTHPFEAQRTPTSIPGMGLDSDIFDKLREPQQPMAHISTPTFAANSAIQSYSDASAGGIPGLGGIPDVSDPTGGRKPLLKQPPPKKAQRQFERVWNVNSRLQGAMLGPADEGGPPGGSEMEYRKPKPSLLGAPPPGPGPAPERHGPATNQQPPVHQQQQHLQQQSQNAPWHTDRQQSGRPEVPGGWPQTAPVHFGGAGMSMPTQPQRPQGQPTNFMHPATEPTDMNTGVNQQQQQQPWRYGNEHGDVDLRHMASGGWNVAQGGSAPGYEDVDYRDLTSGTAMAVQQTVGHAPQPANPRDPRMHARQPGVGQTNQQQQRAQQPAEYRYQNWMDPTASLGPSNVPPSLPGLGQPGFLDRQPAHVQPGTYPQQHIMDPRRSAHQQKMHMFGQSAASSTSSNGGDDGPMGADVHGSRSRSADDQDSEGELYGPGGNGRHSGAPTNPKRKWKQEYEAEEAQGIKRWSLGDEGSYPSDKDERPLWGRGNRR